MGTLRADVIERNLAKLLREFSTRRWQGSFDLSDISVLLQRRGRVAGAVAQAGIEQGIFTKASGSYTLTYKGECTILDLGVGRSANGDATPNHLINSRSSASPRRSQPSGAGFFMASGTAPEVCDSEILESARVLEAQRLESQPTPELQPVQLTILESSQPVDSSSFAILNPGPTEVSRDSRARLLNHDLDPSTETDANSRVDSRNSRASGNSRSETRRGRARGNSRKAKKTKKPPRLSVSERQDQARRLIKNNQASGTRVPSLKLAEQLERANVHALALAYEECLGRYKNNPSIKYIRTVPVPGDKNYDMWLRAVRQAESIGMAVDLYVKAQFYWFDKWWSAIPKPYQISTAKGDYSAVQRARLYLDAVRRGDVDPTRAVLGRERSQPKISKEVRFLHAERTLRSMMQNHGLSEEEVFLTFAQGAQAGCYFDRDWLRQQPTYLRLRQQGAV